MEVAHGEIVIDVRDREAIAALRRIDGEFDRTMDKIDRERATAQADLDTSNLDQDVKNVKRKLRELEGQKATLKVDGRAFKRVSKEINETQANLRKLDGKRATVEIRAKGQDEVIKAQNKIIALEEKTARAAEQSATRRLRAVRNESSRRAGLRRQQEREETLSESNRLRALDRYAKSSASLRRQKENEMRADERAAYAVETARTRSELALRREAEQIPKLRSEYVRLMRDVESFDSKRRKAGRAGDAGAVMQVDIDQEGALVKLAAVREKLERANALDPLDTPINISPGRDTGLRIREAFNRGGASSAAATAGSEAGTTFANAFRRRSSKVNKTDMLAGLGGLASRGLARVGGLAEGLSRATVRIGPFTASIKSAIVGITALGPMLVDSVGALGSLVGVAGSATMGLGALSAGFIAGAIPAALGFGLVIGQVSKDIGKAKTASDAYNKAVREYGKGSEQAAKKQKVLKNVLGSVDASTVKAFTSAQKLNSRWKDLTQPARASVFNTIGDAINAAGSGMDQFAKKTNQGMSAATTSVRGWIKGLSSARGQDLLGNIMGNFNKMLGPALDGLGNLGAAFGKLASVASGFLPGFARQFKAWSDGVNNSADNTNSLREKVSGWVDSLRSAGNFLRSFGNLMKTVFSGGTAAGRGLLDTMTAAMNRWSAFLSTAEGQESLSTFFDRASEGARALFSLLGPIIGAFVGWASAMSPITTVFFQAAGAVAGLVQKILSLSALQGPLAALAATLGTLWAVGKIGTAAVAVGNFTRAMLGLKAASVGVAAAGGASAALGTAGAAAGGAAATRNLNKAGAAAKAAGGRFGFLRAAAGGLGGMLAGRLPLLNPWTAGLTALGFAAFKSGKYLADSYKENNRLQAALQGGGDAARAQIKNISMTNDSWKNNQAILGEMPSIYSNFKNASLSVEQAQRGVAQALKSSGRGSLEHRTALQQLNDTQIQARGATKLYEKAVTQSENNNKRMLGQTNEAFNRAKKTRDDYYDYRKARGDTDEEIQGNEHWKNLTDDVGRYGDAVEQAKDIVAASGAQMERSFKGFAPLVGDVEKKVGRLARTAPKLAVKIATKYESPKNVGKVAEGASRALRAGVPKKITSKIVGDSSSAEAAVKRLKNVRIKAVRFRILQEGGERAVAMLTRIKGSKLTRKQQKIAQEGGPRVLGVLEQIRGRKLTRKEQQIAESGSRGVLGAVSAVIGAVNSIPGSHSTALSASDGASGIIAGVNGALASIERSVTISINAVRRGNFSGGIFADGGVASFASGGTGAGPNPMQLDRAQRDAERRAPRDMRSGGKVARPTMLVGEENKTEVVIATNPRYRKRSRALLNFAARAIGEGSIAKGSADDGLVSAAAGFAPSLTNLDSGGSISRVAESANFSNKKQRKKFRKLKKKKKKQRFAADKTNPWVGRLNSLDTKQSDLEREASIRESDFQEPEDFIIESKSKDAEGNTVSRYTFDQREYDRWTAEMNQVREVYTALQRVVAEIQQAIPKARAFTNLQIGGHNQNISELQKSLNKERKKKFGSGNEEGRAKRDKRVTKLEGQLQKEKDQLTKRTEFKTGLTERGKEAGFDYREFVIASNNIALELGEARENASEQIADGNDTGGSGGGGGDGSGSDPSSQLSYGQQVAAAAVEKQSVLREFSGNMNPSGGQTAIGSASGDTGGRGASGGSSGSGFGGSAIMGSGPAMASAGSGGWSSADRAAQSGSTSGAGGTAGSASGAGGSAGGDNREIYITNNYQEGPGDAHTWSRGMEYEMRAM